MAPTAATSPSAGTSNNSPAPAPKAPQATPPPSEPSSSKPREYNPRWLGYTYIIVTSLACFASIANFAEAHAEYVVGLIIGCMSFLLSLLILLFDRFQCIEAFNFSKACDGKLEGYTLLVFVLLWIIGVALLTKPGGLAYSATNIFFSCWMALASCVYTLNEWAASKEIISLRELTQLSATLQTWYALLLCSLVHFGSAINILAYLGIDNRLRDSAAFAISLGLFSSLLSCFFILVHYKFFGGIKQGGWLELSTAFLTILIWTIGVAVLTQHDGIAPTVAGSGCQPGIDVNEVSNCTVIVERFSNAVVVTDVLSCQVLYGDHIPGSNLYVSAWGAMFASINLTLRWKAAQALQFAQSTAAQGRARHFALGASNDDEDDDEDDFDDI